MWIIFFYESKKKAKFLSNRRGYCPQATRDGINIIITTFCWYEWQFAVHSKQKSNSSGFLSLILKKILLILFVSLPQPLSSWHPFCLPEQSAVMWENRKALYYQDYSIVCSLSHCWSKNTGNFSKCFHFPFLIDKILGGLFWFCFWVFFCFYLVNQRSPRRK